MSKKEKGIMSVMMLSPDHLRVLALAAHPSTGRRGVADADSGVQRLLACLTEANNAAYVDCYGSERAGQLWIPQISDADQRRLAPIVRDPMRVLKLALCYQYQCDGASTWDASDARRACDVAIANAVDRLPGYDDLPWAMP